MFNIKNVVHSLHYSKDKPLKSEFPECLREFEEFSAT